MSGPNERHLYATWRSPEGSILPIGILTRHVGAVDAVAYEFVYLKRAEQNAEFQPLPGLPDLYHRYKSDHLFPVFANRQMPRERPDYDAFVQQLDLGVEADPFEVLARSHGTRATDRIEVFAAPARSGSDLTALFFTRGVRHIEGAPEAIESLDVGEELRLIAEPENAVNHHALLISTRTGKTVGYAPDYLLDTIHDLRDDPHGDPRVVVEHVNPPSSAAHMRLLCRLRSPWPAGYEPLSGPDFQPLVP